MTNLSGLILSLACLATLLLHCAAEETFIYLTRSGVDYYLYWRNASTPSWSSSKVGDVQKIEDFEYNYLTNAVYFTSSQPSSKGIWKSYLSGSTLPTPYKSHQLREETVPLTIRAYPEFDVAYVYDEGYKSILAISLRNEKEDLRIKTVVIEDPDRRFFIDTNQMRLIGESVLQSSRFIFTTLLNGTNFREEFRLPASQISAQLSAFDVNMQVLHYCLSNNVLGAWKLGNAAGDEFHSNLTCSPVAAGQGLVYYTDLSRGYLTKVFYNASTTIVTNSSFMELPKFNASESIVAFKRYEFTTPIVPSTKCVSSQNFTCGHICVPGDMLGTPSCLCTDYYTSELLRNGSTTCIKDTLHSPAIIYAVSLTPNNTLFYRLDGDPAGWIERPQREQLFTIRSGIVGLAFDYASQRLLIAETQLRQIASAKMDGTFNTLSHHAGMSHFVKSIAYDWIGGNVVWLDPTFQWLRIAPLVDYDTMKWGFQTPDHHVAIYSSSSPLYKTILIDQSLEGYALGLDSNAGFIFFLSLNDSSATVSLYRIPMNGSDPTELRVFDDLSTEFITTMNDNDPEAPLPGSLTVDVFKKRVWVAFVSRVYVLDYNGNLIAGVTPNITGLDATQGRVAAIQVFNSTYALLAITNLTTDESSMWVYSINDAVKCCTLTLQHQRKFFGVFKALVAYQPQPNENNVTCQCSSAICVPTVNDSYCTCPDGYAWNSTNRDCQFDNSQQSLSPLLVYNTQDRICHRSMEYVGTAPAPLLLSFMEAPDYCMSNGKKVYSVIEPDHVAYRLYAVQANHMPSAIYNLRLKNVKREQTDIVHLLSLTMGLGVEQQLEDSDVFYSGNNVVALAFDWLARNLYIADQSTQNVVVLRDSYQFPALVADQTNVTTMIIDAIRRKLYWAIFSNSTNKSDIFQLDLAAASKCLIVSNIDGMVLQMQIDYQDIELMFLHQPGNSICAVDVTKLPPYTTSCPNPYTVADLTSKTLCKSITKGTAIQFAMYRNALFVAVNHTDLGQSVYVANDLSAAFGDPIPLRVTAFLPATRPQGPIKALAVVDPSLTNLADNDTISSFADSCSIDSLGACEQLCLSRTVGPQCSCTDGMSLLPDGRHCAPRRMNISSMIIAVDDYHHKVFIVPLDYLNIAAKPFQVNASLSALSIHAKARPYSVAFDPVVGDIYFGDHERGTIVQVNPEYQMARNSDQGFIESPILLLGNKVYGLFVDPISRLLFYTHREGHYVAVYDIDRKMSTIIYMANSTTNAYGVVMDRRNDRLRIYFAIRHIAAASQQSSSATSTATLPPGFAPISNTSPLDTPQPQSYSAIITCLPDGSNCSTLVSFSATGTEEIKSVPWIYELDIDYTTDRLYFTTGQNRSIMYTDLWKPTSSQNSTTNQNNWNIFATEGGPSDPSFLYGLQVYRGYVLVSDWQHRGIHVFDIASRRKQGVIGGTFFTGLNGLAVYDSTWQPVGENNFNKVCQHNDPICSHICIPMPNSQRICKCPGTLKLEPDGVNCEKTPHCPMPDDSTIATFDADCTYRIGKPCTLRCGAGSTTPNVVQPSLACQNDTSSVPSGVLRWDRPINTICVPIVTSTTTSKTTSATQKTTATIPAAGSSSSTPSTTTSTATTTSSTPTSPGAPLPAGAASGSPATEKAETRSGMIGLVIGLMIIIGALVGATVGLVIYLKRRPNARGFRRLGDAPFVGGVGGDGTLVSGSAAIATGLPPGTVAFRNPMFGMEDIDNVTIVEPRTGAAQAPAPAAGPNQGPNHHELVVREAPLAGPREGQVVIF